MSNDSLSVEFSAKQMLDLPPPSLQPRNIDRVLVLTTIALLTLQTTLPIRPTIAIICIRTMHRLFPKQNMPHVFQNSPTIIIIQLRVDQPFSDFYIDVLFVFPDCGSSGCELRAASCSYGFGNW